MQTAGRRRTNWAIAASIAAHLGLLTAVLLQRPTLKIPVEPGGPPVAIIPILIMPRTPAPLAGHGARPAPIQLHRRPQRNLPAETPVAPLVVPTAKPAEVATPAPAAASPRIAAPAPAPPEAVRATLRATLGCNEARLAGLSREERAGCLERLGRGAGDAPYLRRPSHRARPRPCRKLAPSRWRARKPPSAGRRRPRRPPRPSRRTTAANRTSPPTPCRRTPTRPASAPPRCWGRCRHRGVAAPRNRHANPGLWRIGRRSTRRMQKAGRRRTTWAVAASLAAHLAVLVMALLQRPNAPLPMVRRPRRRRWSSRCF